MRPGGLGGEGGGGGMVAVEEGEEEGDAALGTADGDHHHGGGAGGWLASVASIVNPSAASSCDSQSRLGPPMTRALVQQVWQSVAAQRRTDCSPRALDRPSSSSSSSQLGGHDHQGEVRGHSGAALPALPCGRAAGA
jgi:hypothetical protein